MYLTTTALVLRVSAYNDTDAMLTVLTQQHGKISAKVRGLRRKNSPLSSTCQLLAYGEFTFFAYNGSYTVNEAHSIELFTQLRQDLLKLSLGTYFAQVAEVISQEDFPNPALLSLTLNCLYALCRLDMPENKIKAAFEMRAACLAGYTPELGSCALCGCTSPNMLNISGGTAECAACRDPYDTGIRLPVTQGVLDALRYIISCPPKALLQFDLPEQTLHQLSRVTEAYFSAQLERGFSALDFYKSLLYQDTGV